MREGKPTIQPQMFMSVSELIHHYGITTIYVSEATFEETEQ